MSDHEISTILQAIARLEVKVDTLVSDNTDMEMRMRSVERTRAAIAGLALAFGGSAGALISKLIGG